MRLEDAAQYLLILAVVLGVFLWFSVEYWEQIVAPTFQTIGAWFQLLRVPVLAFFLLGLAFLLFRLNGPR